MEPRNIHWRDFSMFESMKCPCQFLRYKAYFYCRLFCFFYCSFFTTYVDCNFLWNNVGWMISLSISTMQHRVLVLEKFLNLPWAVLLPRWGQHGTNRPTSQRMKTTCSANRGWKLAAILLSTPARGRKPFGFVCSTDTISNVAAIRRGPKNPL